MSRSNTRPRQVKSLWLCKKLIDRVKLRSLSWLFDCHRSRARNIKKRLLVSWLAPKEGAIFSLIYFFKSFCIYHIPHNYVIPQAMPHAILQTHSAFYPHRNIIERSKSKLQQWSVRLCSIGKTFGHLGEFDCVGLPNPIEVNRTIGARLGSIDYARKNECHV